MSAKKQKLNLIIEEVFKNQNPDKRKEALEKILIRIIIQSENLK